VPIALAPDGRQLAYTVQDNGRARAFDLGTYDRTGVSAWAVGTDIWIQDIESGAVRNLTEGKVTIGCPSGPLTGSLWRSFRVAMKAGRRDYGFGTGRGTS